MIRPTASLLVLVLAATLAAPLPAGSQEQPLGETPASAPERVPVLVEMFTSQNCPNSPAGESILTRLDRAQPIEGVRVVPLAFHVPYWDSASWKDPFAHAHHQWRQNQYSKRSKSNDVYTPQFVIDGDTGVSGRSEGAVRKAIVQAAKSPKATIRLELRPSREEDPPRTVRIGIDVAGIPAELRGAAGQEAEILVAVAEKNLVTEIAGGKNVGTHVEQTGVVRTWMPLGHVNAQGDAIFPPEHLLTLDPSWKLSDLTAVVWIQQKPCARVVGLGTLALGN
jgi:hypothetical protein